MFVQSSYTSQNAHEHHTPTTTKLASKPKEPNYPRGILSKVPTGKQLIVAANKYCQEYQHWSLSIGK